MAVLTRRRKRAVSEGRLIAAFFYLAWAAGNCAVANVSAFVLVSKNPPDAVSSTHAILTRRGPPSGVGMGPAVLSATTSASSAAPDFISASPSDFTLVPDEITPESPLRVIIAGAGVGGLALANALSKQSPLINVRVIERTDEFKRFDGPIQLASNALEVIKTIDGDVFDSVMEKFTFTGDKENGIKDGIRSEWYAMFDLASPAEDRGIPYTGVIDRPDLQEIYLESIPSGTIKNGDGVETYARNPNGHGVKVTTESGEVAEGDVLVGADGIWSAVHAMMRDEPAKGDGSGVTYLGFAMRRWRLSLP